MNVFDFDNTIYDGESLIDFFLFCIKKKKNLSLYLPLVMYTAILYKLNLLSIDKLYELASRMSSAVINNKENADLFITEFWEKNEHKLKKYYLDKINSNDVIISASPRILLDKIKDKLKTNHIICSEFNLDTGKFEFICFGKNKVTAFKQEYSNTVIDTFYTDSKSDYPLMELAKNTYLVKKNHPAKLINKH